MTEASTIFKSTSQAIHFSYLIEAYEPGAESAMGKIIRKRMQELGLENNDGVESTVDFDGLNALEVRGQAAMIRGAINTKLTHAESWAVKAKYGLTRVTERKGLKKSYSFTSERIDAMRNLSAYIAPAFASHGLAERSVLWLVAKACGEIEAVRPSFRDIEELTGASKSQLCRVYPDVKKMLRGLEQRAVDRLTPLFKKEGIVP